jgi:anti-sigma factor ChrR (cupin superfamily)
MDPIVLKIALTDIDTLEKSLAWKPFRPGVEISRIYNTPNGGCSAAFLKYQPGAAVPLHMHGGYEHIFILKGSQVDRSGEHLAGSVVINPPGSSHTVSAPNGCIVLIVWEKPVILAEAPR